MKTYIYYCPTCKSFYRFETDSPNEIPDCPGCGVLTRFTGLTKEDLEAMTPEEKEAAKRNLDEKLKQSSSSLEEPILCELKKMSRKVNFLYGLAIAQLVLWVLSFLLLAQ